MTAYATPQDLLATGRYFGRTLASVRVPGFTLTETSYDAGDDLPPHAHERAFFSLTLAGAYLERAAGCAETAYPPYTAVFHPPGEEHVTHMGPAGGRVLNVEVDAERLRELCPRSDALAPHQDLGGGALALGLARLRCAVRRGGADGTLDAEAAGAELLAALAPSREGEGRAPRWLARVVERLRAEGPDPSLGELAAEAGVHPVHVARTFRRFHGASPGAFRRTVRLQRACRLLERKGACLAEVAALSGFSDQSHLTRALKRALGETPKTFRYAGIARPRSSSSFSR